MQEHFLDMHNKRKFGRFALHGQSLTQGQIAHNLHRAVDTQGVFVAGNQKQKPDMRVLQHVGEGIRSAIAWTIRDDQMLVI